MARTIVTTYRQELTVGVGERPEYLENDEDTSPDQQPSRGNGKRTRRRQNGRRRTGSESAKDAESAVVVGRELPERRGDQTERRSSRDRALTRLLAGLRAMDAGDFSVRLAPNGDPLMAELIHAYNSVAERHNRLSEEIVRV